MGALDALCALVERLGDATLPLRALREELGRNTARDAARDVDVAIAAARGAGIVRDAEPSPTFECPGAGCAREVRHGRRRILAVCTRDPAECETLTLTADDLAQASLSVRALAATACRLFGIEPSKRVAASGDEPILLGEQRHGASLRDVFFALHPARAAIASFLALRERAARATLVIVPTNAAIAPELSTRHGPGAHVELVVLADALTLRDDAIVLAPRLRVVRAPDSPSAVIAEAHQSPTSGVGRSLRARLPAYEQWSDLHFRLADGLTLLVTVGRSNARVSYIDLDLAHASTREPLMGWKIIRKVCEGSGSWDWMEFGDKDTVPQLVSELQKTLMRAFDLEDKPFARLTRRDGYKPKFRASPGSGESGETEGGWR
jgi:hypothetical protein